ncbi:MAG: DUF5320 domain-containing protein [Deltaproteobacteria bacterium]|nr:DUF5320 domain-containing protein [Deltaproteobacteria bacterium]
MGMGPMTGGGRGLCNPLGAGYWIGVNPWFRYRGYPSWPGYGYGPYPRGGARLWQAGWPQPWVAPGYIPGGPTYGAPPEQELDFLRNQASVLQQQMDQIVERIGEIEKKEEPKKKKK